jgi:PAS domain S-box-containing protein
MRSLNNAETLKQFIRNLREGIYITAESGEIVDCNPAFLEMFGIHSLAELKGITALIQSPEMCILLTHVDPQKMHS